MPVAGSDGVATFAAGSPADGRHASSKRGESWRAAQTGNASPASLLRPRQVIPNMLTMVDAGLTAAGRLVLTGAPLEVSTALVTEGVMSGCLGALAQGASTATVLGHIPTYLFGSALYGLAFAAAAAIATAAVAASTAATVTPGAPLGRDCR